ncbi:MAG: hypothetical protein IAE84_11185 [Saprospiraceae bacterium]|jgi:hypothetical protein|nr:hypothetical protein [Saprospiraceae bacterium]HRD81611.1 hypothetical protein [Saprospiraceae bacterium]HRF40486.1 hypothetical protein [Saprospiraceae bacterium]HRK80360.1 hypothetical protein [Saprospiraceae bacterium]
MKSLLKLVAVVVVGVLIYNYFFGTPEEKATSKEIFTDVRDLGKATWGLLKSEKQKFDEGKYDEAVDKVGGLLGSLKSKAKSSDDDASLAKLEELERRRLELEQEVVALEQLNKSGKTVAAKAKEDQIRKDWRTLMDATELVMNNLEKAPR